jgi:hypothetical protein
MISKVASFFKSFMFYKAVSQWSDSMIPMEGFSSNNITKTDPGCVAAGRQGDERSVQRYRGRYDDEYR